jgi:hypothetical protein
MSQVRVGSRHRQVVAFVDRAGRQGTESQPG